MKNRFFASRLLCDIALVVLGNTIYAAATVLFVIPLGLITCGSTGVALFVNRLTGFPVVYFTYLFYALTFLLGSLLLGKRFAVTSLISSLWYPIAFSALEHTVGGYTLTDNALLATLYAGLMIGVGIGIVLRIGASTGGTDVLPLALQKHFGTPLSVSIWGLDVLILAMQMLTATAEQILYGLLMVILYSYLIDRVLLFGRGMIQVTIVSDRSTRLAQAIFAEVDRGVTFLHGRTGYRREERDILLTVASARELAKLERLVARTDPAAFMIVHSVREVRGYGFTTPRERKRQRAALAPREK